MAHESVVDVLAKNVEAEMTRKYGSPNQSALARDAGLAQRTIGFMLKPESRLPLTTGKEPSPGLAQVAKVAAALNVEVWELLHPDRNRVQTGKRLLQAAEEILNGR